jgi:hypothetical protein
MNALVQAQLDWEGLVAANEAVLEERVKFIQANVGEVKVELQELRAADNAPCKHFFMVTENPCSPHRRAPLPTF